MRHLSYKIFHFCVKGWGYTKNEDCFTNNNGPNKHAKCRFPFIYKGKYWKDCIKNPSPSKGDRRCQQFKADKGIEAMPKEGESLMIKYNRGRSKTVCYSDRYEGKVWKACNTQS